MRPLVNVFAVVLVQTAGAVPPLVNPDSLRGKVMCGYQGWFRCPGDACGMGWIHYSRNAQRISPRTLTFEMWPDMREYSKGERFAAPGFQLADGPQGELFSSDNAATVLRHFQWMRDYGIDGAWIQHFLVDLPGGPGEKRYISRRRVLAYGAEAARKTGRVWALSFDIAGMPVDRIYDVLTAEWKRLMDAKLIGGPHYLHEGGLPVVQIWGFYRQNKHNAMTPELAERLIAFFQQPGPYRAFLAGGGDWNWRNCPDPAWRDHCFKFGAYSPWNVGNYSINSAGAKTQPRITGRRISGRARIRAYSGCRLFMPASVGTTCAGCHRGRRTFLAGAGNSCGSSFTNCQGLASTRFMLPCSTRSTRVPRFSRSLARRQFRVTLSAMTACQATGTSAWWARVDGC